MPRDRMTEAMKFLKMALEESQKVETEKLDDVFDDLSKHYSGEFIPGLTLMLDGYEHSDNVKLMKGQVLLDNWDNWFYPNVETIRRKAQ